MAPSQDEDAGDEEVKALKAKVAKLKEQLAAEKAELPSNDNNIAELQALWGSFPYGEVGQGLQPKSRFRNGPLSAIWKAYFEHTMPGGLKSAALLRFANRTDIEIPRTYPTMQSDWFWTPLEVSLVIHSECYDSLKMEMSSKKGRNVCIKEFFEYETLFSFPQFPYRVQVQDVRYLGGLHTDNIDREAAQRLLASTPDGSPPKLSEELDRLVSRQLEKEPKRLKIATAMSAHAAVTDVGFCGSTPKFLARNREDDYDKACATYRQYHALEGYGGAHFPPQEEVHKGILVHMYPKAPAGARFKPTRVFRGFLQIGWWFGHAQGPRQQGAISYTAITDVLPQIQQAQPNNPFEILDWCGIFMQCRGWLCPNAQTEVILLSDVPHRNQLFILLNKNSDVPALSGFVKYTPRHGDLYRHEVLLATKGLDFLIDFARKEKDASAAGDMADMVDLSEVTWC